MRKYRSKLTEDDVRKIKLLLREKKTLIVIANLFGVTKQCISLIKTGKTWVDLS